MPWPFPPAPDMPGGWLAISSGPGSEPLSSGGASSPWLRHGDRKPLSNLDVIVHNVSLSPVKVSENEQPRTHMEDPSNQTRPWRHGGRSVWLKAGGFSL